MNSSRLPILVVEDDPILARSYSKIISEHAGVVHVATKELAQQALSEIQRNKQPVFSLAIVDLHLGTSTPDGLSLVAQCRELGLPCFVLSSSNEADYIEDAYLHGCLHFLNKNEVKSDLHTYLYQFYKSQEEGLEQLFEKYFLTKNTALRKSIGHLISQNLSNQCLFISGPTGTGKSHLARLIHDYQATTGEFVSLHCGEIAENLLESELFGHVKGAFTGADRNYSGRLRKANYGTLFLDEVGSLGAAVQVKLLKAIEERQVIPVGSNESHQVQFTLISATWENIFEKIEHKEFRQDLWFRLQGHHLHLTPLSERPEDIEILIEHFMEKSPRKFFLAADARDKLLHYHWPGNARELQRVVKGISLLSRGIVRASDIVLNENYSIPNQKIHTQEETNESSLSLPPLNLALVKEIGLSKYVELIENQYVNHYLKQEDASVSKTIRELKLSSARFYRIQKSLNAPL